MVAKAGEVIAAAVEPGRRKLFVLLVLTTIIVADGLFDIGIPTENVWYLVQLALGFYAGNAAEHLAKGISARLESGRA